MKLLGKQVQYFGMDITITMPFVATDEDGYIACYNNEPEQEDVHWIDKVLDQFEHVGTADLEGQDWKETLVDNSRLFKKNKKGSH